MSNFDSSLENLKTIFNEKAEEEHTNYIKDDNKRFNLCYVLINNIKIGDINNEFNDYCGNKDYTDEILINNKLLKDITDKKMQNLFYNIIKTYPNLIIVKLIISYALFQSINSE